MTHINLCAFLCAATLTLTASVARGAEEKYYVIFDGRYCGGPHPHWLARQSTQLFPSASTRVVPESHPDASRLCKGAHAP